MECTPKSNPSDIVSTVYFNCLFTDSFVYQLHMALGSEVSPCLFLSFTMDWQESLETEL